MKTFFLPFAVAASASLVLVIAGCSQKVETPAPAVEANAWNWESFPESKELLLAQLPATIQPLRSEIVRAPASGRLVLEPTLSTATELEAGFRWGRIESDDQGEHAAAIDRLERALAERRKRYRDVEQPFAVTRAAREIRELENAIELARFAERSPELFTGDEPTLDPQLRPNASTKELEQQLEILRGRHRQLIENAPAAEPPDVQALVAELAHRRDLEGERRARLDLRTNFRGRLIVLFDPAAGARHVEAGEVIARVEDDSAFEVEVPATLPFLHAVPAGDLMVRATLPSGDALLAESAVAGVDLRAEGPVPVLRFKVKGSFAVRPPAEVQLPALVHVRLTQPARIVPKLELVRHDAGGVLNDGWRAGLPRLLPGCELLAEGRNAIALVPPK